MATVYEMAQATMTKALAMADEFNATERLLGKYDLTAPQFNILTLISTSHTGKLGNLADTLRCSRGNLTGVVKRLERKGFITRTRSTLDERVVTPAVTDAGRDLLLRIQTETA